MADINYGYWSYTPGEWGMPGMYFNQTTGEGMTEADYNAAVAASQAAQQQQTDQWAAKVANYVNASGQRITNFDPNAYTFLAMDANSGIDNKYETVDSWIKNGAFYDPSLGYFDRQYYLPTSVGESGLVGGVDLNPNENDWGLIPYLAPLALGLIGGGALGLFGGGALGGEAAAGAAAGELGSNATMADIYGYLTNQSVAALPSSTSGALYSAATGDLAAALGGGSTWADLFAQPGSMSIDPNAYGWSQIYGDITGQSVAPDWYSTLANSYNTTPLYTAATTPLSLADQLKNFAQDNAGSIAKTAGSLFQQPAGQALPSIPDFSAAGGTQPNSQRSISQQQQSSPFQLSVPQFTEAQGPQQDLGNYQAPQFNDPSQSWGQPSIFQLSQSTWNPSMANALRKHNA